MLSYRQIGLAARNSYMLPVVRALFVLFLIAESPAQNVAMCTTMPYQQCSTSPLPAEACPVLCTTALREC